MSSSTTTGKIILSGEYAVVFGGWGIAIPSKETLTCVFDRSPDARESVIIWNQEGLSEEWMAYAQNIADILAEKTGVHGVFTITNTLPLGKGMGSSTSLVIAMTRSVLCNDHQSKEVALSIEDQVNVGHSGLDFACIFAHSPVLFKKGTGQDIITIPQLEGKKMTLIDTGTPNESTPELVAWVRQKREAEIGQSLHPTIDALDCIAGCTERILAGEDLSSVLRDHHKAQVALGVVPEDTQRIIEAVYEQGGIAKVIGAGARTGGGGMVLRVD